MDFYEEIISNIDNDSIIHLMTELGADRYIEREDCIIFPTICHNVDASEASMKLYFYKAELLDEHIEVLEHEAVAWISKDEKDKYEFAGADAEMVDKL